MTDVRVGGVGERCPELQKVDFGGCTNLTDTEVDDHDGVGRRVPQAPGVPRLPHPSTDRSGGVGIG